MRRLITIFSVYKIFWSVCGSILVINLMIYWGAIVKQQNEVDQLRIRYSKIRTQHLRRDEPADSEKHYRKAEDSLRAFADTLPSMAVVSEKARELGEIIRNQGVDAGAMMFKPKRVEGLGLWRYEASITITNQYETIKKLLAAIQNSPSLFCIEHLSIKKEIRTGLVELKLAIATYCR
ncbi:MAG: hypothetical protein ACOZF0_22120 [Thermodesulfobacteriota bacterium]